MIKKYKNIVCRIISMLLVLTMLMPTKAFAGTYTVNSITEYEEKLKNGIMNQEESIIINLYGDFIVGTEFTTRVEIENIFEEVKKNTPHHFGDLNIINETTFLNRNAKPNESGPLKGVTYTLKYKISKNSFEKMNQILSSKYMSIKTKTTDYEKIREAYNYIVSALSDDEDKRVMDIKEILSTPEDSSYSMNAHAVLFAIMMTELGYDNDIATATGTNDKWNLVKVQGLWYHVDGSSEAIGGDNYFLISVPEEVDWDIDKHSNKKFATEKYDGESTIAKQIKYEIQLITKDIEKALVEVNEEISIEHISEAKKKLKAIDEKVENYKAIKDILVAEARKTIGSFLDEDFINLDTSITNLLSDVSNKKTAIVNGAVNKAKETLEIIYVFDAIEATGMPGFEKLEGEMIALELAIKAIEKSERTKLKGDIELARVAIQNSKISDLRLKLEERIKILEATILVEKAEKTKVVVDIEAAVQLVNSLDDEVAKLNLENRLTVINDEINAAKELVNSAENSINAILDNESLEYIILVTEDTLKKAETEVKKIKDMVMKTIELNRIKEIKLAIAAIKAVVKAETPPLKTTNVSSARKAIEKINQNDYVDIKNLLNDIIDKVDKDIKTIDAEKLVEKAESSLKRTDYDKAKAAVEKLRNPGNEEQSSRLIGLENRIIDNFDVIIFKEAVENAEKLMKANKDDVSNYLKVVVAAEDVYNKIVHEKYDEDDHSFRNRYGELIFNLDNRIKSMENAISAIEMTEVAAKSYSNYLIYSTAEYEDILETAIEDAKTSISKIDDNNANLKAIRKSLVSRLIVFSDRLIADGDYNEVSSLLVGIEEKLISELSKEKLNGAIDSLQRELSVIVEASTKVKDKGYSKDVKDRITAINDVIAATKVVTEAEDSDEKTISKNITAANKAVGKLSTTGIYKKITNLGDFKASLQERIIKLEKEVETVANETKAKTLVDKAINSKKESDIKVAIEAVAKLADQSDVKDILYTKIEDNIIKQLINDANNAITTTISSIELNDKSVTKNVAEVKRIVSLIHSVVLLGDNYKTVYENDIKELNDNIKEIDKSVNALNLTQQAEKAKKQEDVNLAKTAIIGISGDKYANMIIVLTERIQAVKAYIDGEAETEKDADEAVSLAEGKLNISYNPSSDELRNAQNAVNNVNNKVKKADLQKRIDAINKAIAAKAVVERAEAYTEAVGVKAAEKALDNLVKTGSYLEIAGNLNGRIGELNKKLSISKLVTEATNLVDKAINSRKQTDIEKARFAVNNLKELAPDSHERLENLLNALDDSIKNEADNVADAIGVINMAIEEALEIIYDVNIAVTKIKEGEIEEEEAIKELYKQIDLAKNQIIIANAAVRKLGTQKELLTQITNTNKEIDLTEDNLDIKEAVRLVTIASSSVINAKDEHDKSMARLDIAAARRGIDKIGHINNKAVKVTILNTINAIENKLTLDNDQALIDIAVDSVNGAADMLAKAVRENKVKDDQEQIDKAIFSTKMAIGWISDNNKNAKNTLTGFINDISAVFNAEKEGILNEERIKNAEKAVSEAEAKKESNELESYIRSARLRIKMIKIDGPETEATINDLNTRLDLLEGKNSGGSGNTGGSGGNTPGGSNSGSNKPGGNNSGGSKPGGSSSSGNKIPVTPLPESERPIGTTEPVWGETKELRKIVPVVGPTS